MQANTTLDAESRRQAALEQAQIDTDMQQYDKAAAVFAGVLAQLEPDSQSALEVRLQRGDMYYNAERYREAAADYVVVADGNASAESVSHALYLLGNSAYQHGEAGKDKDAYTQASERLPPLSRRHPGTGEGDACHVAAGALPGRPGRVG